MDRAAFRTEIAAAARLAGPLAATQLGMMLMGTIDTMMLGHLSAEALAAGSLGNVIVSTAIMFVFGVLGSLDPLVAQAHGARNPAAIGAHLQRGLVLAAALTVPFVLLLLDIGPWLRVSGQAQGVSSDAASYVRWMLWGALPSFLFVVLRQTMQAMSHVRATAAAIVLGNLANLGFNWLLIFGHWGFPALGVRGSALSTSISRWVMFVY